jgi:hypothetical protein
VRVRQADRRRRERGKSGCARERLELREKADWQEFWQKSDVNFFCTKLIIFIKAMRKNFFFGNFLSSQV